MGHHAHIERDNMGNRSLYLKKSENSRRLTDVIWNADDVRRHSNDDNTLPVFCLQRQLPGNTLFLREISPCSHIPDNLWLSCRILVFSLALSGSENTIFIIPSFFRHRYAPFHNGKSLDMLDYIVPHSRLDFTIRLRPPYQSFFQTAYA